MTKKKAPATEAPEDYEEGYGSETPETTPAPKAKAKDEARVEVLGVRSIMVGGTAVLRRGKTMSLPASQAAELIKSGYATEVR